MGTAFIDVVAAAILSADGSKVLITRRHRKQHQGGLWEFPGGKVELDESLLEALYRELDEELNLQVITAEPLLTIEHKYSDKWVRLHVYTVREFSGMPKANEQQPMRWAPVTDLPNTPFPEANQPIVEKLVELKIN